MTECNVEENKTFCNCTYPCGNKGICCKCIRSHIKSGEVPACFFPDDVEKTYDRSIENFIRVYQKRGL